MTPPWLTLPGWLVLLRRLAQGDRLAGGRIRRFALRRKTRGLSPTRRFRRRVARSLRRGRRAPECATPSAAADWLARYSFRWRGRDCLRRVARPACGRRA